MGVGAQAQDGAGADDVGLGPTSQGWAIGSVIKRRPTGSRPGSGGAQLPRTTAAAASRTPWTAADALAAVQIRSDVRPHQGAAQEGASALSGPGHTKVPRRNVLPRFPGLGQWVEPPRNRPAGLDGLRVKAREWDWQCRPFLSSPATRTCPSGPSCSRDSSSLAIALSGNGRFTGRVSCRRKVWPSWLRWAKAPPGPNLAF